MAKYDPLSAAVEIREQLASEKRKLGFFFGAGTSMAVGLPGIIQLTKMVRERLQETAKSQFISIEKSLPKDSNVENILDRIRIYRELIGSNEEKEYEGLKGAAARDLDCQICQAICDIVSEDPQRGFKSHSIFAKWLLALHSCREWPVEIFTTNYDLLFERAMEDSSLPFFDGFVGSVSPFFLPESVDISEEKPGSLICAPKIWTRFWKLHGSVNWYIQKNVEEDADRISRLSGSKYITGKELVIFPSREKYAQSRKLPFLTFQDRFRRFLMSGECCFVVVGYSFSDEHLNDSMFQALRANSRLAITVFLYSDLPDRLAQYGERYRNLTFYAPDKACIGGITNSWCEPSNKSKDTESQTFWESKSKRFRLGDFLSFTSFLEAFIGFQQISTLPIKGPIISADKAGTTKEDTDHEK